MSVKKKNTQQLQLLRDEALDAYLNREDFQYNMNADALYRHYQDQYTRLGKTAMEDTMGQAAALTGGYGSSYAQSVGQQTYNRYLQELGDVVPELYQLAYDRYQDRGDQLYKTYQSWEQLAREAEEQDRWEQEYALAERKRQDENDRFQQEMDAKNGKNQSVSNLPAYYAWLATYQGAGQRSDPNNPTMVTTYNNGKVSTGNILTIQRVLGLKETGMWTYDNRKATELTADEAWEAYQQGKLQNRVSLGMGDMGLANSKVRLMERVLGLRDDGYWSEEDKKAAGGMDEATAWEAYQRGKLHNWR